MKIRLETPEDGKGCQLTLVSSNGTVICRSRTYTRRRNAMEAAKLIKAQAGKAKIEEAV